MEGKWGESLYSPCEERLVKIEKLGIKKLNRHLKSFEVGMLFCEIGGKNSRRKRWGFPQEDTEGTKG